jgi:arylsulfatase A-like enzyme
MSDRPNILLVQADQHRFDCVGVNGDRAETPTLDALAADGANCTNAYTPIPICTPARASLMTGQWPSQHGIVNLSRQMGGGEIPPETPTFSRVLQRSGYETAYVGRWHLGPDATPLEYGFEEWVPNARYHEWRSDRGFPERPTPGWTGGVDAAIDPESSRLGWAADRVIEQLDELAAGEAPFLLRWDTWEPHLPNVVPEPYASMYDPDDVEQWGSFDDGLLDKPWVQRQQLRTWNVTDRPWDEWAPTVARYLGEIALLDDQLGRILERLDELGLTENTLVVYTADHGDMCGAHGMMDKHFVMYDDVVRVPLLARWPAEIDPGTVIDDFVSNAIDLPPTFCDIAEVPAPATFAGESLCPLFAGRSGRSDIFATYYGCQLGLYSQRMLRTADWKYVWNATAPDELYDLQRDPHECTNVANDPEHEATLTELRARLATWLRETDDDLVNPWTMAQLETD